MTDKHSGVYFIRRSGDGAIKIGYSRDVARRIATLQTGCPDALTLAGLMVGGTKADEWNLQQRFRALWVQGEWFKQADELLEYVGKHPPPEYFNEDRRRVDFRRRIRRAAERTMGGHYPGPVPARLAAYPLPASIPLGHRQLLLEWATQTDLSAYVKALERKADAARHREYRSGSGRLQTEDPAIELRNRFWIVTTFISPIWQTQPDWTFGEVLRFAAQHEAELWQ